MNSQVASFVPEAWRLVLKSIIHPNIDTFKYRGGLLQNYVFVMVRPRSFTFPTHLEQIVLLVMNRGPVYFVDNWKEKINISSIILASV